jgi:hypothetical protein
VNAAPDYIEPVVGWRIWYVFGGCGSSRLMSIYYRSRWPVGSPLVASCRCIQIPIWPFNRSKHEAPGERCTCGIYAGTLDVVRRYLPEHPAAQRMTPVIGRVSLWGIVREHDDGWRAERAYPQRLYVPEVACNTGEMEDLLKALNAYCVPVDVVEGATASSLADEVAALAAA